MIDSTARAPTDVRLIYGFILTLNVASNSLSDLLAVSLGDSGGLPGILGWRNYKMIYGIPSCCVLLFVFFYTLTSTVVIEVLLMILGVFLKGLG